MHTYIKEKGLNNSTYILNKSVRRGTWLGVVETFARYLAVSVYFSSSDLRPKCRVYIEGDNCLATLQRYPRHFRPHHF